MQGQDVSSDPRAAGIRVLLADDDPRVRELFATLLRAVDGIAAVIEAQNGAEAVQLGGEQEVDVAVLDLNMPGLDGVEAALRLAALAPSPRIALHSANPELLRQRAHGLELPLFDKLDPEPLREWVERQATELRASGQSESGRVAMLAPKVDLYCSVCCYGIVCRKPPQRCPMCGGVARWSESAGQSARRALLHDRLAG
jgi:CheY-like chemotaxis protein